MTSFLVFYALWNVLGIAITPLMVGKPRQSLTRRTASLVITVNACFAIGLMLCAYQFQTH